MGSEENSVLNCLRMYDSTNMSIPKHPEERFPLNLWLFLFPIYGFPPKDYHLKPYSPSVYLVPMKPPTSDVFGKSNMHTHLD